MTTNANFCNKCGYQLAPGAQASSLNRQHLAYVIAGIVGLCSFAFFYSALADMEEDGGHMRMHVIGWLIYGVGGKFLLSLVIGGITGTFAWWLTKWQLDKTHQ